jgi:hypothetical protein
VFSATELPVFLLFSKTSFRHDLFSETRLPASGILGKWRGGSSEGIMLA